jgi:hypothetical protein
MRTSSSSISFPVTKQPTRETDHSLPPSAEARQTWTPPQVPVAQCFRRPTVLNSTTRVQTSHLHCFANVAKWAALLHIREVLGSYPDPRNALRIGCFLCLTRFLYTNAEIVPKIRPGSIPSASFLIGSHPIRPTVCNPGGFKSCNVSPYN